MMEQKNRILIVEDDPVMVSMLENMLEDEGYEVRNATGEKALQMASEYKPNVVLLDIMMPQMDGLEWSNRAKADPYLKNIPIIALSAADNSTLRRIYKDMQADSFLSKPFDLNVLMGLVYSLANR